MKGLKVVAVIMFIIAGIMLYKGYDKMTNYSNPEDSYRDSVNAYVGGDAYNYIINGNYATGFFVLAVGSAISGFICLGTSMIMETINNTKVKVESNPTQSNNTKIENDELPPL